MHDLNKVSDDKWSLKLELPIIIDQPKYQYKYVINGSRWQCNSNQPRENDGKGNENNVLYSPAFQKP